MLTNTKQGKDFRDGNGVLQNYESAKSFFVLAAQDGHQEAMLHLAQLYKDQKIVDEPTLAETIAGRFDDGESKSQLIKAHMWANLAGNELTQTIEKQLNPEEIKQAQDLAKDCLENDYQGC